MFFLKIKINLSHIKWALCCFLLLWNLVLLVPGEKTLFVILFLVTTNTLGILSVILLTFFPRLYYFFTVKGISYQNRKGNEFVFIPYESILKISYVYVFGIIREGVKVVWKDKCETRNITLIISPKQAKEMYDNVPAMKEKIDS